MTSAEGDSAAHTADPADDVRPAKAGLRLDLLSGRMRRSLAERQQVADALRHVVNAEFGARLDSGDAARLTVAVYLSVGTEPGTGPLCDLLCGLIATTIAPALLPDGDLDWAPIAAGAIQRAGARATVEPPGPRLGVGAVAAARLLLVPALAVDGAGNRLGRGGGSYDRALARVPAEALVLAVVHDDEVLPQVPREPHDRPVDGALTPSGVRYFSSTRLR